MKCLLIGKNGQIGHACEKILREHAHEIVACDHKSLDISDRAQVFRACAEYMPDVLINTAAFTNVDAAEDCSRQVYEVNVNGPKYLAEACAEYRIPLIHVSTDYVFDGNARTPYCETDVPAPLSVYGQSKLKGEEAIRAQYSKHFILRTSWVFSEAPNNFVQTMLSMGENNDTIRVVSDQEGCPTCAEDVANVLVSLALKAVEGADAFGTYHYCSATSITWHAFAEKIFEMARAVNIPLRVKQIEAITTQAFGAKAKRPAYSVLDCKKIENQFGITPPSWEEALARYLNIELLSSRDVIVGSIGE